MLQDAILVVVLLVIIGCSLFAVIKSKKSGKTCIGCPGGGKCSGCCGCSSENKE